MKICGIDPGLTGGLAIIGPDGMGKEQLVFTKGKIGGEA